WVNGALEPFGLSLPGTVFGLNGILLAHVFLNGALVAGVLFTRLRTIAPTRLKIGQSLALGAWARFRLIDWPEMVPVLPGLGALVFLLAFTSFPVVLLLGGGPANRTFEVAIYAAVRLDFDLAGAVRLALVQLAVAALIIIPATAYAPAIVATGTGPRHHWRETGPARWLHFAIAVPALLFLALPLAAIFSGLFSPALPALLARSAFWAAAGNSFVIASASAALALVLGYLIAAARAGLTGHASKPRAVLRMGLGVPALAYLGVPAVVLSLGFFLIVRGFGANPGIAAPFVLILANALMSLPFALAALGPALDAIVMRYYRLQTSLHLSAWVRFHTIDLPLLARPATFVFALAFCFSFGDLGVVSLFGTERFSTLPWLMMQAMGAYRTSDANVIAAILGVVTLGMFLGGPALAKRVLGSRPINGDEMV
ncbi:MAG: thiamine/thiamine pyrophosphate ABC transporter permease ThiP, partial [Alphaproteobacteria bacterium]|nr:thiamine/thiamine pyrophosphate ABC transporter permease ThiP [Alphaproteobacteria bacterium]